MFKQKKMFNVARFYINVKKHNRFQWNNKIKNICPLLSMLLKSAWANGTNYCNPLLGLVAYLKHVLSDEPKGKIVLREWICASLCSLELLILSNVCLIMTTKKLIASCPNIWVNIWYFRISLISSWAWSLYNFRTIISKQSCQLLT